jgi:hypothetical protein
LTRGILPLALRAIGFADVRFGIHAFAVKTGALNRSATSPFSLLAHGARSRATTPV